MEHSVGEMAYGILDHEPMTGAGVLDWALYEQTRSLSKKVGVSGSFQSRRSGSNPNISRTCLLWTQQSSESESSGSSTLSLLVVELDGRPVAAGVDGAGGADIVCGYVREIRRIRIKVKRKEGRGSLLTGLI